MTRVALAAPHHAAVAAGERAIAAGGNALDAALAAAVTLTVVYPHQCALGGDLIAVVRAPDGRTRAVVAAGTAPRRVDEVSGGWSEVPRQGAHAVSVPGIVAGWSAIHGLGARRPLADAFEGAAGLAADGEPVSAGLARALVSRADAVMADPGLRGVFAPEGRMLAEGELLQQPALAATLRRLAVDPTDIYRGRTAAALLRTLSLAGGVHEASDFADYRPEIVPALQADIDGATWSVAPPPSVGPILLGVASAAAAARPDPRPVFEASLRGVRARAAHLGDPRAQEIDLDALLDLRSDDAPDGPGEPRPSGDTASVTAADEDGWAITIVQSVYMTFGASLLDPETGIVLHNRGSAFSADPASPAFIRPGARPPHTLCPAIVDDGAVTVVAGCQGGRAQPWILAQLLPDTLDPAQRLDDVLARPRWVVGDRDLGQPTLSLVCEPGAPDAVRERAAELGIPVIAFPGPADEAGHVQLVRVARATSTLEAASDPRADGAAFVGGADHADDTLDPRRTR